MEEIGDVYECQGEVTFEWKIKDFSSLSAEINVRYESPKFYFSGASWKMRILPNGEKDKSTEGFIGTYIIRMTAGLPINVSYSLGIKSDDSKLDISVTSTNVFDKKSGGWGISKILSRSVLEKRKAELIPSNILTLICTMKHCEPFDVSGSLFNRQQEICDNLNQIYSKGKRSDFTIKIDGKQISTHRMILETRSPVFAAMLNHDTEENQTGELSIIDIDKDTMSVILKYMYTGEIGSLTIENASNVYAAAEKYDLKNLKQMCSRFMIENLSVNCLSDVMEIAELYQDKEMARVAVDYFKENAQSVLESENWQRFAKENPDFSNEVLGNVVKALSTK